MAFATVQSWSETRDSNTEIDAINIDELCLPSGINNAIRELMAQIAAWTGDDTIASATTTDLSTVNGQFVSVTGTTTITGLGTVKAGWLKFLHFAGALTLTHNATSLILPGAANIATVAGDTAIFVSLGSGNWRCVLPPGYISLSAANTWTAAQTVSAAGVPFVVNSTNSNANKIAIQDNGTVRGYIGGNANGLTIADNGASVLYNFRTDGQMRSPDGSAGAPTYGYSSDADTGTLLVSSGVLGFTASGTTRVTVSASEMASTVPVRAPDGSVSAPAYTFSSDTNTGFYGSGSDNLIVSVGGGRIASWGSAGYTITTTDAATTFGSVDAVKNLISGGGQIDVTNTQSGAACRLSRTTDGAVIQYHKGATLRGSHSVNDTGTTFNNTSDGELKVDRVPIEQELDLDRVYDLLGPLAYTMINSETLEKINGRMFGFVAQDLYYSGIEALKQFVVVGKGKPGDADYSPWMLNYLGLLPIIWACMRWKHKKIEARLDAAGL